MVTLPFGEIARDVWPCVRVAAEGAGFTVFCLFGVRVLTAIADGIGTLIVGIRVEVDVCGWAPLRRTPFWRLFRAVLNTVWEGMIGDAAESYYVPALGVRYVVNRWPRWPRAFPIVIPGVFTITRVSAGEGSANAKDS